MGAPGTLDSSSQQFPRGQLGWGHLGYKALVTHGKPEPLALVLELAARPQLEKPVSPKLELDICEPDTQDVVGIWVTCAANVPRMGGPVGVAG